MVGVVSNNQNMSEVTKLPASLFEKNRRNFIKEIKKQAVGKVAFVLPKSGESWFYYLFGDSQAAMGIIMLQSEEALLTNQIEGESILRTVDEILVVSGINSDSYELEEFVPECISDWNNLNKDIVFNVLSECRVCKSDQEVEAMIDAQTLAANAILSVMRTIKPGIGQNDVANQVNSYCGARNATQAYQVIVAHGKNVGTLRYFQGAQTIKDNKLLLVDVSLRKLGYTSDLTITFPVNGKFTEKQRNIYEIVLNANRSVIQRLKPGVLWQDMHLLAERIILQGLQKLGVIKQSANIDIIQAKAVGTLFFPNGVGHLIGLEVQDCGGYLSYTIPRSESLNLLKLRHSRQMKPGLVTSVEPGCYFSQDLFEQRSEAGLDLSCVVVDEFKKYIDEVGGVRVEDVIVITEDGCKKITPEIVPRSIEEVEAFMAH